MDQCFTWEVAYAKMVSIEPTEFRASLSKRTTKNSQKERNKPEVESEDSDIMEAMAKANATGEPQAVYSKRLKCSIRVPPTSIRIQEVNMNVKLMSLTKFFKNLVAISFFSGLSGL